MKYLILTEPKKSMEQPSARKDIFWSKVYGSFSNYGQATLFDSFEEAQPDVKRLREFNPFVYAIRSDLL